MWGVTTEADAWPPTEVVFAEMPTSCIRRTTSGRRGSACDRVRPANLDSRRARPGGVRRARCGLADRVPGRTSGDDAARSEHGVGRRSEVGAGTRGGRQVRRCTRPARRLKVAVSALITSIGSPEHFVRTDNQNRECMRCVVPRWAETRRLGWWRRPSGKVSGRTEHGRPVVAVWLERTR